MVLEGPVAPPQALGAGATSGDGQPASAREALASVAWLSLVPSETLDWLAEQAVLHRVPSGSIVFEQAETPTFAQFVIEGSVEMLGVRGKTETFIELVRPVDLLLPAAVLSRQPFLLRARVRSEARLLMIHAEAFRDAIGSDHALCLAVLSCQAGQFRRQVKQAKNVRLRSAQERVGCYLLRLLQDLPQGTSVRLPLEKWLIASELGMTRETFSRTLAGVARHGIRVDGDLAILEDPAKARANFILDPLIDGSEMFLPLQVKGARL